MTTGWSEKVRIIADKTYVQPARRRGEVVRIVLGDFKKQLESQGFPENHPNQIGTALESRKFWQTRGMKMTTPPNQPRRNETSFEFIFVTPQSPSSNLSPANDPLLGLVGILEGAIPEGAGAFVREIRRDKPAAR
jgi:hypothetical protein